MTTAPKCQTRLVEIIDQTGSDDVVLGVWEFRGSAQQIAGRISAKIRALRNRITGTVATREQALAV